MLKRLLGLVGIPEHSNKNPDDKSSPVAKRTSSGPVRPVAAEQEPPAVLFTEAAIGSLRSGQLRVVSLLPAMMPEIPGYSGPRPEYEKVVNRLKVLCGLPPARCAEKTTCVFEWMGMHEHEPYTVVFDDVRQVCSIHKGKG